MVLEAALRVSHGEMVHHRLLWIGASQARGGQPGSAYLSAVELSFEISFDGFKRWGYCVVGTKLRF